MKLGALLFVGCGVFFGQDSMVKFEATCHLESIQDVSASKWIEITVPCILQDQSAPKDGYNNRFRVLLTTDKPLSLPLIADYVKVQNLPTGVMRISSILWGSVVVMPKAQWIRDKMASSAPVFEVRPQNLILRRLDDKTLELSLFEHWKDLSPHKYGSDTWERRHRESIVLLGRAK